MIQTLLSFFMAQYFQLHLVPNTRCLDGSNAAYYKAEGSGNGIDKLIFHFEGGGTIGGDTYNDLIRDAYLRSQTQLGSSNNYSVQTQFSGLFSRDSIQNPHFYNWNAIYVKYCDGTGHQGYKQNPIEYNETMLYFQGEKNTLETIRQLNLQGIKLLMVSGFSAGGYAVYNWIEEFRNLLPGVRILGVPDSGLFLDLLTIEGQYNYRDHFVRSFASVVDIETRPPNEACMEDMQWKCLMLPYLLKYIDVPLFMIQSAYDTVNAYKILGIDCEGSGRMDSCSKEQIAFIEQHRNDLIDTIQGKMNEEGWGTWTISCINHGYLEYDRFNSEEYKVNGLKLSDALWNWVNGEKSISIDQVKWPNNQGCANGQ